MTAQNDLPLFAAPAPAADVAWLENMLRGARCWMTAADIRLSTHGHVNERDLRALASASAWIISGQKGYKALDHATPEEIAHASNWLESQAKKMSERACAIRRNAHARLA